MIIRREFYINGAWVAPAKARDCAVINPSNEEEIAIISLGDPAGPPPRRPNAAQWWCAFWNSMKRARKNWPARSAWRWAPP